jgi:hypothetical protein
VKLVKELECKKKLYIVRMIDEIKIYTKAWQVEEIESEAFPSLGGIEPRSIEHGCFDCDLETAKK